MNSTWEFSVPFVQLLVSLKLFENNKPEKDKEHLRLSLKKKKKRFLEKG